MEVNHLLSLIYPCILYNNWKPIKFSFDQILFHWEIQDISNIKFEKPTKMTIFSNSLRRQEVC